MISIKNLQLVELVTLTELIFSVVFIIMLVGNLLTLKILILTLLINVVITLLISAIVSAYSYNTFGKSIFYNPMIGKIEIHIGRGITQMELARVVIESIRLSKKINKNIIFNTNHFTEDKLNEKWGDKMIIKQASLLRNVLYYIPYFLITFGKVKKKRYPLLHCEILSEKL